jgi:hypothetical protein
MFLIYALIYYSGRFTSPYPSAGDPGGPGYTRQNYPGRRGSGLGPFLIGFVDVQSEINKQRFCTITQNRQIIWLTRPRTPPVQKMTPKRQLCNSLLASLFYDCFKNLQKHRLYCKTNTFVMFFASKTLIFQSSFDCCFMCFQNRSWRPFLQGPGADLLCSGRFGLLLIFSRDPKNALGATVGSKESRKIGRRSLRITTFGGHDHIGNGKCSKINKKSPLWHDRNMIFYYFSNEHIQCST